MVEARGCKKRTCIEKREGDFIAALLAVAVKQDERHGGNWLALFSLNGLLGAIWSFCRVREFLIRPSLAL